jgi:hypothetical protein
MKKIDRLTPALQNMCMAAIAWAEKQPAGRRKADDYRQTYRDIKEVLNFVNVTVGNSKELKGRLS